MRLWITTYDPHHIISSVLRLLSSSVIEEHHTTLSRLIISHKAKSRPTPATYDLHATIPTKNQSIPNTRPASTTHDDHSLSNLPKFPTHKTFCRITEPIQGRHIPIRPDPRCGGRPSSSRPPHPRHWCPFLRCSVLTSAPSRQLPGECHLRRISRCACIKSSNATIRSITIASSPPTNNLDTTRPSSQLPLTCRRRSR